MDNKKVVLSGIRATGKLHLGNYLGAMKNFVDLQNKGEYNCFYFVADYHTLTTNPDPQSLISSLPEIVIGYLAAGIDPQKSILYAQSSIPELAELCLLISMVMPVGELLRCPTYKEKVKKQPDNVNHGLLTYPVLMAADILGPQANLVPVGEDQLHHLEITRMIVKKFHHYYDQVFTLPEAMKEKAIRVPGLDGTEKMGKSDKNTIDLIDSPQTVSDKIKTAVTDPQRKRRSDPGRPWECKIFDLHELVTSPDIVKQINTDCRQAKIGCIDCKEILSNNLISILEPMQRKRQKLLTKPDYVNQVLHTGGKKVRKIVQDTVNQVREKMGLRMF